ncbi:hypothetical protein Dsin_016460 [Dipteronia sinensis]|uniref:Uncharacterized protein n=1 Tax=Dipteronia sinensis TaxID=43782 RepID=A0AAE0ADE8_9ROSI|nr:hypothetical protein Dsin_016460 [Dipteronia sinensis]
MDSRVSAFGYNCLEEEVSLHCSRIAEVIAAPTKVSAVLVHEDGYCGRMYTVDDEVLVTQQGVSDALEYLRVKLGFTGKLVVNSVGRSGGLCLFWSTNVIVDLLSFSPAHIDVSIRHDNILKWRFTGFYGHPDTALRSHSWTLLRRLSKMSNLAWLCLGDFNEIQFDSEKVGGLRKNWKQMSNFRKAVEDCGLSDMGFRGPIFTWSNKRESSAMISKRLDRGICNKEWDNLYSKSTIHHLDFWGSNHRPLLLKAKGVENQGIQGNFVQKRRRFYFEECWVNEEEFLSNIVACGSLLDSWNASKKRELRTNILIRRAALKEASNAIIPASWRVVSSLEHHLNCALDTEERYWRQRAWIEWLREEDSNTRFFHSKASARRSRNSIASLINEKCEWVEKKNELEDVISQNFKNIFSTSNPSLANIAAITNGVHAKFDSSSMSVLNKLFDGVEIRSVVFDMSHMKAPSRDGLPALFYQKY